MLRRSPSFSVATVPHFRLDLPVLYVRAGLDHPEMNAKIVNLATQAVTQNAPIALRNYQTGHRGFEWTDHDDAARRVIDETIEFVKPATQPEFQQTMRAMQLDATAAGQLSSGNFGSAATTLAELLKRRPDDGLLRFRYADALASDQQFAAACAEFRKDAPPSFNAIFPGTRRVCRQGRLMR